MLFFTFFIFLIESWGCRLAPVWKMCLKKIDEEGREGGGMQVCIFSLIHGSWECGSEFYGIGFIVLGGKGGEVDSFVGNIEI